MVQYISKGDIFGRIGTNLGKSLAEQLPPAVEQGRLAAGLRQFERDASGLTPLQQGARIAAIPGITPQAQQTLGELAKQQGIRKAYKGTGASQQQYNQPNAQGPNGPQGVNFSQPPGQVPKNATPQNGKTIPSNQTRQQEAQSNPPAAAEHPLNENYVPSAPWNQGRQEAAINEAFDRGIATTFPEAQAYANSQRELYERTPEEYRKQLDYKKSVDKDVDEKFDKQLETRLQKEGKETFADIPGDLQLKIKKKARNSVGTGKMTPEQAAEYYSQKALDLAKDKSIALKIANRDIFDRIIPHRKEETLKNLSNIAKNYTDMGADEDFYNFLTTDTLDKEGRQTGMGLSPGAGAIIQYPRTENVKALVKNTKIPEDFIQDYSRAAKSTRAFAQDLLKVMTPEDSFLAIARQMKQQDINFDEYAFFDYLRENADKYMGIPRLNREISHGVSDFFPNWRDIGLFPAWSKAVTND